MKKIIYIITAAVLSLVACTRNQEIDVPEANLSLFARTESPADTKTVVESGVHVYWEPGDEIAVFMGEKAARFTTDITAASGTATFKGTFGDTTWPEEPDIWAVYPFSEDATFDGETITTTLPSEQVAREGSFGKDMNLAIAHSNSSTLQFYNVGGGIRFSVTEEGIKKVMFEGLGGEIISGKVKIGFSEDGKPEVQEVSGGSQFITLLPPSGEETFQKDTWYYIVAIPGSLESGYKLRFYKDSDYARKVSEKAVEVKRSIFGNIEKADEGIEYEAQTLHFPVTIEEIRESEQRSLELCEQVDDVFRHAGFYDAKADELDIQAITSSIRKIDGVLSANLEESRKMITVMKKDSTIIHFDFDDSAYYEEDSEGDTKSLYSQIKELALRQSNTKSSSTTKKALLLSPFQNSFWVKGQQMGNFHINETEIQDLLRPLGYTLKFLPDEQASLSMFTLDYMADYDLVMIISHGGGLDQWFGTTVISGSYNYTTDNKPELYRLSESYVSIGSIPRYGINPKWLELTYGGTKRFNNSIIYIGSCHSYDVDDMKDVFMQHGAAAYFGFVGEIPFLKKVFNVTAELMYSVIRSLCRGMDASAAYDFIHLDKDLQSAIFGLIQSTWDIDNFRVNPETKENFVFLADPRPKELKADVKGNSATLTWKCDYVFDDCKYMVHTDGRNFWLDPALNPSVSVPFDNPGTYPWSVVTNIYARTTTSDEPEIVTTYRTNGEDFTVKEQNATPEAIDLGLPSGIKWASFNLGATKPEEYGDYFAWGEMEAKSKYDWSTYIWSNGSYSSLTKYYSDDGKVSLDIEDDAAHKKLGSSWHVPTDSDWRELIKYCNWTPTTRNGIDGMLVTSKTTRATLFLPFAGQKDRTFMEDVGTVGYYWTSSLYPYAPCACVGVTSPEIGEIDRCMGIPIRPVFGDSSSGDSNENQGVVDLGLSVKWGTCNLGASKPEEYGDYYAWGETDFYYLEGHAYDNPCNDWKEGKSSGYGGGSYKWYDYSNNTLTLLKYNLDPSLGIVDGKTVLDPEDDAAHVKLGEKWRIPTDNDWVDLCFYCTLTWTTENGVKGIKMTSKKVGYTGRSIFLPAGGSRYDYELYRIGEKGCYWTSTLDYRSVFASSWDFETLNSMNPSNIPRDLGILIRPVYDDK